MRLGSSKMCEFAVQFAETVPGFKPVGGEDGATGEAASYSNGQTPYTRNANQFGFNGSYYYLTANVKF